LPQPGAFSRLRAVLKGPPARRRSIPSADPAPEVVNMPFVIAEPCIGVKDKSCVEVCPVNCIYEGEDQFYIHPDECIDCQACEAACPVQAIFPDNGVPEKWASFTGKNREFFQK
jgi:ferredoxin